MTSMAMFNLYSPPTEDKVQALLATLADDSADFDASVKGEAKVIREYQYTTPSGQNRALAWYAAAILTLLGYGLGNFFEADANVPEHGRWLGLITTDTVLVFDVVSGLLIYGGTLTSPGWLSVVAGLSRVVLIMFGAR